MKLPILSHTFLDNFENCPRKAWHLYVAKDLAREEATPAMQAGIDAHAAFEYALRTATPERAPDPVVASMVLASDAIKHYEWEVAIAETGTPVPFRSELAWYRGKVDVALVAPPDALILDWKTGKVREDPTELRRFALLLQARYPNVEAIGGAYVWLKDSVGYGATHDCSDTKLTFAVIKRRKEMLDALPVDREWEPRPNPLCGWCRVKTCEHWRERE